MPSRKLYEALAVLIDARLSCLKQAAADVDNRTRAHFADQAIQHAGAIIMLANQHLPSGSGIDSGAQIDLEKSTGEKLVFVTAFHHMVDGAYHGWTAHVITARASLRHGIWFTVSGRNRADVKDHLMDRFDDALHTLVHNVA